MGQVVSGCISCPSLKNVKRHMETILKYIIDQRVAPNDQMQGQARSHFDLSTLKDLAREMAKLLTQVVNFLQNKGRSLYK